MDNVTPIDNVDSLVDSGQSDGLLGYIAGQEFTPATAEDVVSVEALAAAEGQAGVEPTNVGAAATASVQPTEVTTPSVSIDPVEKQRYERAISDLQSQRDDARRQALSIAAAARKAEDDAFEASLGTMDQADAELARARHEARRAKEAAQYFKGELETKAQDEAKTQQETNKNLAAYKLAQHLGLPIDAVPTLMTAETANGMLGMAKALQANLPKAPAQAQQEIVANPALAAAGGSVAPAAPVKKAPQRTGDLHGLFAERGYITVATG